MEKYYDIRIPDSGPGFEKLTQKVCQLVFDAPFDFYGRNGQNQNGIDLYSANFEICVQCKNYQGYDANKRVLSEFYRDFRTAYDKFGNTMNKYVFATTVSRDTKLQDEVALYSKQYPVEIYLLFWEDYQAYFQQFPQLLDPHGIERMGEYQGNAAHLSVISAQESQKVKRLHRAGILLQNCQFSSAENEYKEILKQDVQCADAYLGVLMAEHSICNRSQFADLFSQQLIYNDINFKLAREYADGELREYLEGLVMPVCQPHQKLAVCSCACCNTLICPDCTIRVNADVNMDGSLVWPQDKQPWPIGKNLCQSCACKIQEHNKVMQKKNMVCILAQLIGVCVMLGIVYAISNFKIEEFFCTLGGMGAVCMGYYLVRNKKLGDLSIGGVGCLTGILLIMFVLVFVFLVLFACALFLTPLMLLILFLRRLFWIGQILAIILKSDSSEYIENYHTLIRITRNLRLEEPAW